MDDLLRVFLVETSQGLGECDADLDRLRATPADLEALTSILRFIGSVRETSSFLGLPGLHAAAATAVGLLTKAKAGAIPPGLTVVELVRRSISDIRASIEELQQSVVGADPIYEAHRRSEAPATTAPAAESPAPAKRVTKKKQTLTERFDSEAAKTTSASAATDPAQPPGPSEATVAQVPSERGSISESAAVDPTAMPPTGPAATLPLSSIGEPAADGTIRVNAETIQNLLDTVHRLMASQAEMMQLIKQRSETATSPSAAPSPQPVSNSTESRSSAPAAPAPSTPLDPKTDGERIVAMPTRRTMPVESSESGIRPAPAPSTQRVRLFVFQSSAGVIKAVPAELVAQVRDVDLKTLDGARGLWVLRAEDRLIPLVPCDHGGRQMADSLATAILCRIDGAWMGLLARKAIGAVEAEFAEDNSGGRKRRFATLLSDGATVEVIDAARCLAEAIDGAPRKPRATDSALASPQARTSTVVQATDLFERKPVR